MLIIVCEHSIGEFMNEFDTLKSTIKDKFKAGKCYGDQDEWRLRFARVISSWPHSLMMLLNEVEITHRTYQKFVKDGQNVKAKVLKKIQRFVLKQEMENERA